MRCWVVGFGFALPRFEPWCALRARRALVAGCSSRLSDERRPKRKKARLGGRAFWVWLRGLDLNQRPSGYEPDELPGCSTPRHPSKALPFRAAARVREDFCCAFGRPGGDLLSRVLRRSTIGAGAFHGRVRNGIGCSRSAMTTRSAKRTVCSCSRSCFGPLVPGPARSSPTGAARKAERPSALARRPVRRVAASAASPVRTVAHLTSSDGH